MVMIASIYSLNLCLANSYVIVDCPLFLTTEILAQSAAAKAYRAYPYRIERKKIKLLELSHTKKHPDAYRVHP